MNNLILIKYEIKRLMFSKKYFYMVLLLAVWTIDVLMRLIIDGFYGTAPFSKWSYSDFITLVCPVLAIILILLCTSIFNEEEKSVKGIIYAAPISSMKYYFIKESAILLAFIITALIPIIISFVYYTYIFQYTEFKNFMEPVILFLIPGNLFIFGISIILGKKSNKFLYGLILLVFIVGLMNIRIMPIWTDIFGNNYLSDYGFSFVITSNLSEVPFVMTKNFIYSRIFLAAAGCIILILSGREKKL